jgi:hypothetical protein
VSLNKQSSIFKTLKEAKAQMVFSSLSHLQKSAYKH